MSSTTLYTNDSNDPAGYREATLNEILDAARGALSQQVHKGALLNRPDTVATFLMTRLAQQEREIFTVIYLTTRLRMIAVQELFPGTIDGASVYPREVVKEALRHNAAKVIIAHNHPSGIAEPSDADEQITRRLKHALDLVDIRIVDHIIVAGGDTLSFAARGLL
jgi:DNA repair protein RadC